MAIFFTSDDHYGHANILLPTYSNRPFASVEEMESGLINNWNSQAKPEDEIFVLGDFAFLPTDKIAKILDRLNGTKYLVAGNHDKNSLKEPALVKWGWTKDYHEFWYRDARAGKEQKWFFVLSHYPFLTWNKGHRGSIMCHGHSHQKQPLDDPKRRRFDVGVDANDYRLVRIEDLIDAASKIEVQSPHHSNP